MPKNFGSLIAVQNLERYKFDFYRENDDDDSFLTKRLKNYNKLIEAYISTQYRKESFIAGGFFTKYDPERCGPEYQKFKDNQDVNIFVNIGKNNFSYKINELRGVLPDEHREAPIAFSFYNGVLVTFEPDDTKSCEELVGVKHVKIHVCTSNCHEMLNKFTFEPCKIAYKYEEKYLDICNWYLNGGKRQKNDNLVSDAYDLAENYKRKNFYDDDEFKKSILAKKFKIDKLA